MLLLIGLQSGKGLHPDRIFKLPEFQIAKDRRKFGSRRSVPVPPKLPAVKVSQFSLFGNLAFLAMLLSLSLFMFRVFADHTHHALAVHDLALVANLFN